MILGVNGIRLLGHRSGVARCIEALLRCFDEVDHPFSEVRVYTPAALPDDVALPAVGRSVVVPSALPSGLWEQIALPRAHGKRDLLLCPSYISPWAARCPTLLIHHGPGVARGIEGHPERPAHEVELGRELTGHHDAARVQRAVVSHRERVLD